MTDFFFDPRKMTPEEKTAWEQYSQELKRPLGPDEFGRKFPRELYLKHKAVRCLDTRYPSNFIDLFSIPKGGELIDEYRNLLDSARDESLLQDFFIKHPYFICSVLYETSFGHHSRYVFPYLKISDRYVTDFVLCGTSSAGYGWVFVELQSPKAEILLQNGQATEQAREGLHQLALWRDWLKNNKDFAERKEGLDLEGLHESRIHYCLVIGRRSLFTEKENAWRARQEADTKNLKIMSYDRLADLFSYVIDRDPPNY